MDTGTIIVIIVAVLIALFAVYWMRGRGDQATGAGATDISGDQGTDIREPGSGPLEDVEPSGNWSSIDEEERDLDESDEQEREGDQLPRL